jgi:hypothetical protein
MNLECVKNRVRACAKLYLAAMLMTYHKLFKHKLTK